ncbi:universal stress protein [Halobium salinum]|uniref:Universal stress protein n=1 Tax=Halobium salinum TaxID=1364940 RepID=A0ABD5PG77_9EURY|nr:universal stress protein [Halobium salinum]
MYRTIVLATDGSDCADRAADWAFAVASTTGATVHVLSVVDTRSYTAGLDDDTPTPESEGGRLEARANGVVEGTIRDHADADVETVAAVEHGVPDRTVNEYAGAHDADLVVAGTHGWTGLNRFLIGSTAERIVRTAELPVLTVKERETPVPGAVDRVLLPVDRERGAEPAVAHALDFATTFDATLHVLSVVEAGVLSSGMAEPSLYDVLDAVEADARAVVDDVAERATAAGVDSETTVTVGDPRVAINDYVAEHGVDLVVMGTHGRTGLSRYLLGSVAERVVRTADVPVVTVRSFRDESDAATAEAGEADIDTDVDTNS